MTPLYQLTDTQCVLWIPIHSIHAARAAAELNLDIDILRRRLNNALSELNNIRAGTILKPTLVEAERADPATLEASIRFNYPLNGSDPVPRERLRRCLEEWNFMPSGSQDAPKAPVRKKSPFRVHQQWVPKGPLLRR